jgi:hypothetical protein
MLKSQEVGIAVDRTARMELGGSGTPMSSPPKSSLLELELQPDSVV